MDINTYIDHIANLPLYDEEKPYFVYPSLNANYDPDDPQLSNVQFETHPVKVRSIRGREAQLGLGKSGFEVLDHESLCLPTQLSSEAVSAYQAETEEILLEFLKADKVICFDLKRRKNNIDVEKVFDPRSQSLVESVATGAHVDFTLDKIPFEISRILNEEQKQTYLNDSYRFQMINTWRPMLPQIEDSPLAMCDFRTIDGDDLIETDRIYPTHQAEIYYLKHNTGQKWYWVPEQKSSELLIFVSYDSHTGTNPRFCPHVAVPNPLASKNAAPRESVETRSLVITSY